VYYGPGTPNDMGIVESEAESAVLPPALAAAFAAGKQCRLGPKFDDQVEWCADLNAWKPPLFSYDKVSKSLCYCMDHHCILIGKPVGFKNLRNFYVLLSTGQAIHYYLVICIVQRLVSQGKLPEGYWEWAKLALWVAYLYQGITFVGENLHYLLVPYYQGWLSRVHYVKFHNLTHDAGALSRELNQFAEEPALRQVWEELAEAFLAVSLEGYPDHFKSPFCDNLQDQQKVQEIIFGEPLSWRWFLPLPRKGDPLSPPYHVENCQAWANLGKNIERARTALAEHQASENALLQRLSAMGTGGSESNV